MRSLLVAALLCVGVSGCAVAPPSPEMLARLDSIAQTREPDAVSNGAFVVIDKRVPESAQVRPEPIGWAGGFSCVVGILQLGHADLASDRLARLENALAEAFPEKAKGSELIVRRFDIYLNRGAEADAVAWGAAMGSVGVFGVGGVDAKAAKVTRHPKCGQDQMAGGWFDPADLINNAAPLTADIDITVFGKAFTANAARTPNADVETLAAAIDSKSPAFDTLSQPVIKLAIDRLIAKVKAAGN